MIGYLPIFWITTPPHRIEPAAAIRYSETVEGALTAVNRNRAPGTSVASLRDNGFVPLSVFKQRGGPADEVHRLTDLHSLRMVKRLVGRPRSSLLFLALCGAILAFASVAHGDTRGFHRGIVVSCPRAGQIWGSPEMARSLAEITSLGADWVAIHPYAHVRRDGTIRFRAAEAMDYLDRAVELAHAAGVQLFWKPHLAYWGSFEWRGEIDFGHDEPAWRRFFDGYQQFIVDQARLAEGLGVELFSVGVEYERTTHRETEWRRIIAAVRAVYSGRLTYAANWDSLEAVPFWDALDLIGVHAYFPVSQGSAPGRAEIWQGWEEPLLALGRLSDRFQGKKILFAEIGYPRSTRAAAEPWIPGYEDQPEVLSLRQDLIEVALQRIEASPFIEGMFWWKWIPGDNRWDSDFSMKDREARRALERHWAGEAPTAPSAR